MLKAEEVNQEALKLAILDGAIRRVEQAVKNISVKNVSVDNLDEIRAHIHNELIIVIKTMRSIRIPDSIKVSNFPKQKDVVIPDTFTISNLKKLEEGIELLKKAIEGINVSPQVNVSAPEVVIPEIKIPDIVVPPANVTVSPDAPIDISPILKALDPLKFISSQPNKPIAVRISDGQKFLKAMKEITEASGKMVYAFSNAVGMSKDEYKAANTELYMSSTATNTSATVGVASSVIVAAQNRKSLILVNDSDTVMYIAKGATAELNKGVRLNADGGSLIIEDWNGPISAISSGANKNICICETV